MRSTADTQLPETPKTHKYNPPDLFYVPVYTSCLMEAVLGHADKPWYYKHRWGPPFRSFTFVFENPLRCGERVLGALG
jgi:hypothetical protein